MRRRWFLIVCLALIAGAAWTHSAAQNAPPPDFTPILQVGQPPPSGIQYDPMADRFAWVDLAGRLVLVDAPTYQVEHVLYETGAYNAYRFSHDGRYFALAIDRRIELWDTGTGERAAVFEPPANLVQGPLHFTPDDRYLLFDSVVPAPQETRRSENDTSIIPYLWDLTAARDEAPSRFSSSETFYPFFNFRNGLVVGANTFLIAGVPRRLQIIDGAGRDFPVIAELESGRLERDPITVWRSASDDWLYADPGTGQISQIDTQTGTITPLDLGFDIDYRRFDDYDALRFADNARILCGARLTNETPLLRLIFGGDYLQYQNYAPLTVMLLDMLTPMTMESSRGALLLHTFNERSGRGAMELIRPLGILQMHLSPDRTRLLVARDRGALELYNLETCLLERTFYPAEPDFSGTRLLAFNGAGDTIVYDFQRFDANTGEVLAHRAAYTAGFSEFTFGADSRTLLTSRQDGRWTTWDIATGQQAGGFTLNIEGEILRFSPDYARYLTRNDGSGGTEVSIIDLRAETTRTLFVPSDQFINQIIPSVDWERLIVTYRDGGIAVYTFDGGLRLRVGRDDLPAGVNSYGWIDIDTIYALGASLPPNDDSSRTSPPIEYDPSGLPACLVRAYPDLSPSWRTLWEGLTIRLDWRDLNRLAARLCAAVPPNPDAAILALTPTAPFRYISDATPIPYTIPDVPSCLTRSFQGEATDYAALWREISAGLSPEQRAELAIMICEGLITSVSAIEPTPTINPNLNVPPTPTPIEAAPESLASDRDSGQMVIVIDVETGARTLGDYLPPLEPPSVYDAPIYNLDPLYEQFFRQYNRYPNTARLSPDGQLLAEFTNDGNNFISVYRLARPYSHAAREQMNAMATQRAAQRGIGLAPTATDSFQFLGGLNVTPTPTITPTPPPLNSSAPADWTPDRVVDLCPARQTYTTATLPPDYAPRGRILASPPTAPSLLWAFEPENGRVYADPLVPPCGWQTNCLYSLDRRWIARNDAGLVVSRPDGSDAVVLYPPEATIFTPYNFVWLPDNILRYSIDLYELGLQGRVTFIRHYHADTGLHTEPEAPPPPIQVPIFPEQPTHGALPTTTLAEQPGGTLALISTPYDSSGQKLYLYDRATDAYTYFARTQQGIEAVWHPYGAWLDYAFNNVWYRYDPATGTHAHLEGIDDVLMFSSERSPDARYRASFINFNFDANDTYDADAIRQLNAGSLPYKLIVVDTRTGAQRRYCLPTTGRTQYPSTPVIWSPDSRYLAFTLFLTIGGDDFSALTPQPTLVPYTSAPTETPIPLETVYEYQQPVLFILDTETGYVVRYDTPLTALLNWIDDGGDS
jgi:WD40 repeat protein